MLAFGADADVRAAFEAHGITEFDLHTIETKRLRYESGERGLLRDALTQAIARQRSLDVYVGAAQICWRRLTHRTPPGRRCCAWWEHSAAQCRVIPSFGGARASELVWTALTIGSGCFSNRSLSSTASPTTTKGPPDFARERAVKRYNRQLNELIAFWGHARRRRWRLARARCRRRRRCYPIFLNWRGRPACRAHEMDAEAYRSPLQMGSVVSVHR